MVLLKDPGCASDLYEEGVRVHEENQGSEEAMVAQLQERLRFLETRTEQMGTALINNENLLNSSRARHAELQNKENEREESVRKLQEQLDKAMDQLDEISSIPEPHTPEESEYTPEETEHTPHESENTPQESEHMPQESERGQLGSRFKERDCSKEHYQEILSEAVCMANLKKYQHALIHLDLHISATDSTEFYGEAMILKTAIMRCCNESRRGLEFAEDVVYIANVIGIPTLFAKAQLYRGYCLHDLGLHADAVRCYVRASSIPWFAKNCMDTLHAAEKKRAALPSRSRGKDVSPGFQEIPLSTSVKGFGTSPHRQK